ncbi:DUF3418 domain-containing protein [Schaalia sp. ZJ405]|uniref:DUF3418 domain-containing protein n=1 Tax=Schaalia sp. ZJ405 TaxID=2709403 RepID=UPI003FA6F363
MPTSDPQPRKKQPENNGSSRLRTGGPARPRPQKDPRGKAPTNSRKNTQQAASPKRRAHTRGEQQRDQLRLRRRTRRPHYDTARPFRPFTPDQLALRAASIPVITYPDLPVSARRHEIADAIRDHQVVIVSGETGSGKTTQLPKICLQLGRGVRGLIGHTQPRRIAARSVADRIAEELGQKVGRENGQVVGYQVRFTDEVGPTTLVKLMTDGILLAEIQSDPLLSRYDTLIIDEAHERSLNIDFILGYLARLLPMRPDLKVIITSATIDSQRFAEHFGRWDGIPGQGRLIEKAPVIEVSGRTFPVEIRYRPLSADVPTSYSTSSHTHAPDGISGAHETPGNSSDPRVTPGQDNHLGHVEQLVLEDPDDDLPTLGYGLGEDIDVEQAICHAVDELIAEDAHRSATEGEGDILVFLPGERDIRDTEQALLDHLGPRGVRAGEDAPARPGSVEVIPLFARLTAAEQHRVFEAHRLRRVVLATNVAETSLTVPGIRYVIDPGMARISRYSNRTKVQRLPIEPVSQASANQRAGRSGRVADGIAIRLYSQRDYEARPEFTEPEILRTSLASVILQMASLGLGSIQQFPFLDPPDRRAVRDGIQLLVEIGALDEDEAGEHSLTPIGRDLAHLPIDPRLGRMLLEGDANGCASEVLVIVAALSIQDVRERPLDHQQAADASHARFADPHSDFITYLNLWRYLHVQQRDLSGSAFRRLCRAEFLHYLRFREWRDVVTQLQQMARPLDLAIHPLSIPSSRDVVEAAQFGGTQDAAARAVVAFTQGHTTVDADEIHRSLLVGLLSNVGSWDEQKRTYQGTRGTRFTVWPGSGLARSHPAWVMTAELVETSRLFARTVARIRPEWIEPLAAPLVKRIYSQPYWSSSKGAAMVKEKVLLYGLTLSADRPVLLGRLGDTVIGSSGVLGSSVATPGSLAGIAQGLLGDRGDEDGPARRGSARASQELGSVGRDILALALAASSAAASDEGKAHGAQPDSVVSADAHFPAATGARGVAGAASSRDSSPQDSALSTGASTPGTDVDDADAKLTARTVARDMFISHALVAGQWRERHAFQKRNDELLEQAREIERRSRRRGLVADEDARFRFFDDVIPEDVVSTGHFNRWWKRQRVKTPDLLTYTSAVLLPRGGGHEQEGFPDHWMCGDIRLRLDYEFSPGSARDGITMTIPIEVLERVTDGGTDWLVPGMREELITETIRALPKAKRRLLAPAPEVGAQASAWMAKRESGDGDEDEAAALNTVTTSRAEDDPLSLSAAMDRLAQWGARTGQATRAKPKALPQQAVTAASAQGSHALADSPAAQSVPLNSGDSQKTRAGMSASFAQAFSRAMRELRGVDLSDEDLAYAANALPDHLRMTYVVVDGSGRELGSGTDLTYLQRTLAKAADQAIRHAVRGAVAQAFEDAQRDRSNRRGRAGARKVTAAKDPASTQTGEPRSSELHGVHGASGTAASDRTASVKDSRAQHALDHSPSPVGAMSQAADFHQDGLTEFPIRPLPRSVESTGADGVKLRGFPALINHSTTDTGAVSVRVMANAAEADRNHRVGLARLLLLKVQLTHTRVTTRWTGRQALMLAASPYANTEELVADAQYASALSLVDELSGPSGVSSIRSRESFDSLAAVARDLHEDRVYDILGHVVRAMEGQSEVDSALREHTEASMTQTVTDVAANTKSLVYPGFVAQTPLWAMPHLARYLRAGAARIARASSSPGALARDLEDMGRITEATAMVDDAQARADTLPFSTERAELILHARWMLQELRVSFFAQQLGTPTKVSVKRIRTLLGRLT